MSEVTLIRADNPSAMTLEGTNTWVLADGTVIDPGPDDPAHLAAIVATGPVRRILITHSHPDHVAGVPGLVELTGAVVGDLPAGLRELKTPGHTSDSVCFVAEAGVAGAEPVIFTGDTILGRGSSVVAWPDGDVGAYLRSLAELEQFAGVRLLPGHGPAQPDCAAAAKWLRRHREERLEQVQRALEQGARTADDVVNIVYVDTPAELHEAALWTVRAQLEYLQ